MPNATFDELSPADCRRLAELHVRCLPDSLVARLGHRYAAAFYRYVKRSPHEFAFLRREGGEIAGACIVSLCPKTLDKRLATSTPLLFWAPVRLFHLPLGAILRDVFRCRQAETLGTAANDDAAPDRAPEVILLFTAPEAQHRGLATALLARCEGFLSAQGCHDYVVRTFDREANLALKFYSKKGFVERRRFVKYGQQFRLLAKGLGGRCHQ